MKYTDILNLQLNLAELLMQKTLQKIANIKLNYKLDFNKWN
jgi:hypothetical protein